MRSVEVFISQKLCIRQIFYFFWLNFMNFQEQRHFEEEPQGASINDVRIQGGRGVQEIRTSVIRGSTQNSDMGGGGVQKHPKNSDIINGCPHTVKSNLILQILAFMLQILQLHVAWCVLKEVVEGKTKQVSLSLDCPPQSKLTKMRNKNQF